MARRHGRDINDDAPKTKVTKESFRESLKIFEFIKAYKWYLVAGLIMLFLSSLIFMIFPYLIGLLIDVAQGTVDYDLSLNEIGVYFIFVLIAQAFTSYGRVLCFANVSDRGTADIRKALYKKMISLPISFFEENKMGDLISRMTSDVERMHSTFSVTLAEFLRQIITMIAGFGFLLYTTPRLSIIMIMVVPVVVISGIFFGRYIRKFSKARQKKLAETNSLLGESLQSILVVKAFVNEFFEIKKYNTLNSDVVKISLKYARVRALFAVFIIVVFFGALFFIIWQGTVMVQNGTLTAGQLVSFMTYTLLIGGSIASVGNFYPQIVGALGATERVREILKTESEVDLETKPSVSNLKLLGDIQFQNVHFQYPTRPDIKVLNGVDLKISAGQKIALVGPSGVGKSTIIQLLLQFYKIAGGVIVVDGKSIYDYNIRDFRNNIAFVPQEVILFGGTIRENILYGKEDATEDEVIAAAKQSNSWEFIQSFPEGLETLIGERGVKLSGGQRQRIAIARAILKNPSILLLDEATSSLDAESEKVVQDALEKLMENRTSIIIAHRLSTIREVDCIYVLDNGKIEEKGTHEELSMLDDGVYRHLAKLQFNVG